MMLIVQYVQVHVRKRRIDWYRLKILIHVLLTKIIRYNDNNKEIRII